MATAMALPLPLSATALGSDSISLSSTLDSNDSDYHDHTAAPAQKLTPRLPLELVRLIIRHSARLPPAPSHSLIPSPSHEQCATSSSPIRPPTHPVAPSLSTYIPAPLYPASYTPAASPPRNTVDLRNACLVDRSWRDLGVRELYKHVQVRQENAAKVLGALWRCVRAARGCSGQGDGGVVDGDCRNGEDEGSGHQGLAGDNGAKAGRMQVKTLELVSLPDCADIHATPGVAELYGMALKEGKASIATERDPASHAPDSHQYASLDDPVEIDHLIIHDAALWTLALAYTFDRHHRATHPTGPASETTDSTPSWSSTPHKHPYLALLAHLAPRRITIHYPSAQRAMYLRRRSYIPICCGRPECRAALAKLWSAPVVPRDVARDICDELWPCTESICRDCSARGGEKVERETREIVIGGIVDEQPPMLSFIHPSSAAQSCDAPEMHSSDDTLDNLLDDLEGRYSITFAPCLCANPIYADDYCPNHVSIDRRAMQVAAVLDGRLGLDGARRLAKDMLERVTVAAARETDQDGCNRVANVADGDEDVDMADSDMSTGKRSHDSLQDGLRDSVDQAKEGKEDVADVLLERDGHKLELCNVALVGWTNKTPGEVKVAIWQEVWDMLAM